MSRELGVVRALFLALPVEDQRSFLTEFVGPGPGGAAVFQLRVLLAEKPRWKTCEIKHRLIGTGLTDKTIYNLIGYFTRRGVLRRVGHGKYVVAE